MTGQLILCILAALLFSLFLGTPVSSAMGFTATVFLLACIGPKYLSQFGTIAYTQGTSMNQLVAPLFILMAEFLARGGIAEDIYYCLNKWLRKVKGGLALSTTLACTVFAALCGSSPATAAAVGRVSTEQMTKRGYTKDFAVGTVAGGGTLGIMIPPSITLVTYGILTETSIAKLLMAGLLPGLMLSALMCVSIIVRVRLNPALIGELKKNVEGRLAAPAARRAPAEEPGELGPARHTTLRQELLMSLPAFALILIVLGSLYSGLATPTESAGFGVIGALVIILLQRRMTFQIFRESMMATAKTGTMIIFLMIAGFSMSYVLSYLGIATQMAQFIVGTGLSRWTIMILLYVLWFILGCLMDPGSMVILTIPFVFETLMALGFDPIWLGIVSTVCVEIGMITPPVGLNLFILRSSTGVEMKYIIKGAIPYVLVLIIGLVILSVFPGIALLLPNLM